MVKLVELAHGRSGDKGNMGLIGLIAREPKYYEIIDEYVTEERVEEHFGDNCSRVEKYRLPNIQGFNFVLHDALDGGGHTSLRVDRIGKTLSTALLRMEIDYEPDQ
jgi:hypothetical protein